MTLLSDGMREAIEAYLQKLWSWGCDGPLVRRMERKLAEDALSRQRPALTQEGDDELRCA